MKTAVAISFYGHSLYAIRFFRLSSTFVAQRKAEVNGKICYLKFEYILRVELDLKVANGYAVKNA